MGSLSVELNRLEGAKTYFRRALNQLRNKPVAQAEISEWLGGVLANQVSAGEVVLKNAIAQSNQYAGPYDLRTAQPWRRPMLF